VIRVHIITMGIAPAYLIESEAGLVLVDAGLPGYERRVLRRMQRLGRDDRSTERSRQSLRLIYVTHAHLDHYGSAAALRRFTGAPIAVHRADADVMARGESPVGETRGRGRVMWPILRQFERLLPHEPTPPDLLLNDGDDLRACGLDAVVVHTPGHTPGSSCLIVEGRLAFVGDLLANSILPRVQRSYAYDWALIPQSLARVQALEPEWVYPGHGRPLSGERFRRLTAAQ
jgi:glyoxylase-like metal-dependent hydrolase (beta-lactamase superfamily II)